jgi:hypothetical protein
MRGTSIRCRARNSMENTAASMSSGVLANLATTVRGLRAAIVLAGSTGSAALPAVEVHDVYVGHDRGTEIVRFDMSLNLRPARVHELLTDYAVLPHLIDALQKSSVLENLPDGRQRVLMVFHPCLLMFCKTLRQVLDVKQRSNGDIYGVIVPADSDFKSGWESWQIFHEHNHARLVYNGQFTPDFALPPGITTWILRHELYRTLLVSGARMEALRAP